jgi:hypothetical protein
MPPSLGLFQDERVQVDPDLMSGKNIPFSVVGEFAGSDWGTNREFR